MTNSRPLRIDARRNRDAILSAARETFETDGVLASLDGIAIRAGVGNATLYRNFPTRDDLLAAVMQAGIDSALEDADELTRSLSPRAALAEWLVELAWRLRIWHDLPYCLAAAHGDPGSPVALTVSPLLDRTAELLRWATAAGEVTVAITAEEVYELVTTLSWGIDRFGDDAQTARRRVEIATAGLFA